MAGQDGAWTASSSYRVRVLALLLIAASVGMSNFGAAIAIGVSGVDARTRLQVGLIYGAFETGMPVIGLIIGDGVAAPLGHAARWIGAGLLVAVGGYALVAAARAGPAARASAGQQNSASQPANAESKDGAPDNLAPGLAGTGRLLLSGLALSVDNLAVGFALGTYDIPIAVGAIIIGVVSVTLSLLGLELGARIGKRVGERGEQLAALVLISVGIAIACGAIS
ncbi:MAG TPA: manganese efflux pump [Streptosporangiaceae bacterium]|nr:manganese efflux pump [Streptosporangiaceae bacterium]